MGGGFGSKFSADRWGIDCAEMSREAKAPVKLFLERNAELAVAGDRPSAYARIKVGAKKDGTLTYWASESWGSGGISGSRGSPPLPYVVEVPNRRQKHISVVTNSATSRAWRAPNHPQACFLTMSALEDLAAALKMDPLDFFLKNVNLLGERADIYESELKKGAELIGWRKRWHPRGEGKSSTKQGLGLAFHTWGGRAHQSNCEVVVYPDGNVEAKLGSQDLGTGTRTVVAIVLAETFGLPLEAVKVSIGDSRLPASGASGGSTTVGGVCAASRRAALNALEQIFAKVATHLGVAPDQLEVAEGIIRVKTDHSNSLSWKEAVAKLGVNPITVTGSNPGPGKLTDSGVGGVQMADVSVDIETGVVKVNKFVAAQDCGLIVDLKTAESQVYGAVIMGIAYALSEEKIIDPVSGRMLNANLEFYKLPGIGDIGEVVVHMMTGPGYDERGIIGLGEPPVISPGAAISNAVANAIGVRVPYLPITPDRVLNTLEKGGAA
jgi:xanthine dehydrogenase YagR molybdenum-binding subunit